MGIGRFEKIDIYEGYTLYNKYKSSGGDLETF